MVSYEENIRFEGLLTLKILKGDQQGETYSLDDQNFQGIISRGSMEQIDLDDLTVSSPHAVVAVYHMYNNRKDSIRDLGSKNGTYINGVKLTSRQWADLNDGDLIQFGLTKMRYIRATRQLIYENSYRPPITNLGGSYLITRNKIHFLDFKSTDPTISVPHVSLKATDSFLEVRDLSSGNGVNIHDKPIVDRQLIFSGDLIQFGQETEIQIFTDVKGIPEIINEKWERLRLIDEGGMAIVYKVRDIKTGQIRAMKIPHPQQYRGNNYDGERFRRLFTNEAQLARKAHSDNLVEAYSQEEIDNSGLPYLIMNYIEGPSVKAILRMVEQLSVADIAEIITQVSNALKFLHLQLEYVHCDVKPDNILIDLGGKVYLSDLGVATRIGEKYTRLGVESYLPKEVFLDNQPIDISTDIYSLGQTMAHMLTNQGQFEHSHTASVKQPQEPPATNLLNRVRTFNHREKSLVDIIKICVDDDHQNRYQRVLDLIEALAPLREGANLIKLIKQTGWKS